MGAQRIPAAGGYAEEWKELATFPWALPHNATATDAEIQAMPSALRFVLAAKTLGAWRPGDVRPEWDSRLLLVAARPRVGRRAEVRQQAKAG